MVIIWYCAGTYSQLREQRKTAFVPNYSYIHIFSLVAFFNKQSFCFPILSELLGYSLLQQKAMLLTSIKKNDR